MSPKTPHIIQYFKNYHYLTKKNPDYKKLKPKLIKQIQYERISKLLKILLKLYDNS